MYRVLIGLGDNCFLKHTPGFPGTPDPFSREMGGREKSREFLGKEPQSVCRMRHYSYKCKSYFNFHAIRSSFFHLFIYFLLPIFSAKKHSTCITPARQMERFRYQGLNAKLLILMRTVTVLHESRICIVYDVKINQRRCRSPRTPQQPKGYCCTILVY